MIDWLDDFARPTLGTTDPNGGAYLNAADWTLDADVGVRERPDLYTPLVSDTGLVDGTFTITMAAAEASDNIVGGTVGVALRWQSNDDYLAARYLASSGDILLERVSTTAPHPIWDGPGGPYLGTGIGLNAGSTFTVEMVQNRYRFLVDGDEIGTIVDPDWTFYGSTVHGLYYPSPFDPEGPGAGPARIASFAVHYEATATGLAGSVDLFTLVRSEAPAGAIEDPDGDPILDPTPDFILEPAGAPTGSVASTVDVMTTVAGHGPPEVTVTSTVDVTTTVAASGPIVAGRTFALAGTVRAPVAYGPRVTTATPPVPLAVRLYWPDDLTAEVVELDTSRGRQWQDQLNEAGTGTVVVQNDDPALAEVGVGDVVRFELYGYAAFAMIVRETNRVSIDAAEEHGQATTITGPGVLAVLDGATVYPSRGIGAKPIQEDRVFNWTAVDFNDLPWGTAAALVRQGGEDGLPPLVDDTGATGSYWAGMPANWPDPDAMWIWAHWPNALEWAPAGSCYFRTTLTVPDGAARIVYFATFDGLGELYLDGQLIASGEYGIEPDVKIFSEILDVTAGPHTVAVRCENDVDPEGDEVHNPGGVLFAAYAVDSAGRWLSGAPLLRSDDTWKIVEYPPSPPGMTPGEVLRHVVQEAQGRGALAGVTLAFTDEVDSDGVAWPEVTDIATRVGTDLLTFARELTATYVDVWMEPAQWRLWAWVQDGRRVDRDVPLHPPTDPLAPASGNLVALTHRRAL